MIRQEKVDSLYGERNNKMHLKKSNADWLNHQSSICLTKLGDFIYTLKLENLPQEVCCIKYKMENKVNCILK